VPRAVMISILIYITIISLKEETEYCSTAV